MYIDRIYVEIHICDYKALENSVFFAMGNFKLNLKKKEKSEIFKSDWFFYITKRQSINCITVEKIYFDQKIKNN